MSFVVREATRQDAAHMQEAYKQMGWRKPMTQIFDILSAFICENLRPVENENGNGRA